MNRWCPRRMSVELPPLKRNQHIYCYQTFFKGLTRGSEDKFESVFGMPVDRREATRRTIFTRRGSNLLLQIPEVE